MVHRSRARIVDRHGRPDPGCASLVAYGFLVALTLALVLTGRPDVRRIAATAFGAEVVLGVVGAVVWLARKPAPPAPPDRKHKKR